MARIHINTDCRIEGQHVPAGETIPIPDERIEEFRNAGAHITLIEDEPEPETDPAK